MSLDKIECAEDYTIWLHELAKRKPCKGSYAFRFSVNVEGISCVHQPVLAPDRMNHAKYLAYQVRNRAVSQHQQKIWNDLPRPKYS